MPMCVMDAVNQIGAADVRPDDAREGTPDDSVLPSGSCATPVCRSRCRAGTGPDQPTGSGPHSHAGKRAPRREGAVRRLLSVRGARLQACEPAVVEEWTIGFREKVRTGGGCLVAWGPHSHAEKRAPRREGAVRRLLPDVAHASRRANQQWWRSRRMASRSRSLGGGSLTAWSPHSHAGKRAPREGVMVCAETGVSALCGARLQACVCGFFALRCVVRR